MLPDDAQPEDPNVPAADTAGDGDEMSKLMAEMDSEKAEKSEGGADTAEDGDNARVLNQDEIDSLLGFDNGDGSGESSGINAILDKALMAYEKLPMLEI